MPKRRNFLLALSGVGLEPASDAADESTIYIPDRQRETDRAFICDFIEEFSFAMLVTAKCGVQVTNVPTVFDRSSSGWGKVWWHLSKANNQNQVFDGRTDCTVVFHGPHGYISPNWYASKQAVPTWNFAVVHATGKPQRIDGDAALATSLERLVVRNERAYGGGGDWDFSKLPEAYLKGMRQGIVAYEMVIDQVEAKFKLSQERSAGDRAGLLRGLKAGRKQRGLLELTEAHYARIKD